jgi:hypothetical protein
VHEEKYQGDRRQEEAAQAPEETHANAPTRKLTDEISATTMPTTSRGTPAMGYVFRDVAPAGVQIAASVRRVGLSTSAGVTVATGFGAGGSSTSGGATGSGGL